jgi:transcriptional regulator with XRE-family HTH domain
MSIDHVRNDLLPASSHCLEAIMPVATVSVNEKDLARTGLHGARMNPVMTEHRDRVARRLNRLLEFLGKDAKTFADETGLDRSYVSRLTKGERGGGTGVKLLMNTERVYKVDGTYWTSERDLDPAVCINITAEKRLDNTVSRAESMTDSQRGLLVEAIEAALDAGAPPEVIMALTKATPPPGKELSRAWWFNAYHEAMELARRPKR